MTPLGSSSATFCGPILNFENSRTFCDGKQAKKEEFPFIQSESKTDVLGIISGDNENILVQVPTRLQLQI